MTSDLLNEVLDQILRKRHSTRSFSKRIPDEHLIRNITQAGLYAPYAALSSIGPEPYRKIFVIRLAQSTLREQIQTLARQSANKILNRLQQNSLLSPENSGFSQRLKQVATHGIPGIQQAPYLLAVAEKKGFPPIAQHSIAHCLQNMWLKSEALGLAFQLLSIIEQFGEEKDFLDQLKLPHGQYALNGCLIGYEVAAPSEMKPKTLHESDFLAWIG